MAEHLYVIADFLNEGDSIIAVEKGRARRILPQELEESTVLHFYRHLVGHPHLADPDFEIALEQRINYPLAHGIELSLDPKPTKFDNRKLRFAGARSSGKNRGELTIAIGPCHFGETQVSVIPAARRGETAWYNVLLEAGEAVDDRFAYFSRNLASCVSILSTDGCIPVFRRKSTAEIWPSYFHVIGGMVDANAEDVMRADDPCVTLLRVAAKTAQKELVEEQEFVMDNEMAADHLHPTGLFDGVTVDFTYHLNSRRPINALLADKRIDRTKLDHDEVRILDGPKGVAEFLGTPEIPIVPTGFGCLLLWLKSQDHRLYENVVDTLPVRYDGKFSV